MKKMLQIVAVTIVVVVAFLYIRGIATKILMKNANYGIFALAQNGTDILFMGSSMFRQGIDTKDISIEGKSTYLLAYNGFQPCAGETTLKEVLSHTDIDCLVIDMYLYTVTGKVGISDTRLFQGQSVSFLLDLFGPMKENGSGDYYDLFEMVFQSNNEMFLTWPISYPVINSKYYRGSKVGDIAGSTEEKLYSMDMNFNKDVSLNPVQTNALEHIIDMCKERNIEVVFLETPKYKRMYEEDFYTKGMQLYIDYLEDKEVSIILSDETGAACRTSDKVRQYEYDVSNTALFSDLIHLSSEGRRIFTTILQGIL